LPLSAPAAGQMSRVIHERVACRARVRLWEYGIPLVDASTDWAGHESMMDEA